MGGTLKKYELQERKSEDPYHCTDLVYNNEEKKKYIIKQIKIKSFGKESFNNLKKEVVKFSNYNHNNLINYEYEEDPKKESFTIKMEYYEKSNLREFINFHKDKKKYINKTVLYLIILDICLGIKKMHQNNFIHSDLNPEKLYIDNNYRIKISSPGISKYLKNNRNGPNLTNYTSPESMKEIYDTKSDIWSLGCIIYELSTLKCCFEGNWMEMMNKITNSDYNKEILDEEIKDIVELCLEKDYNKRSDINGIYRKIIRLLDDFTIPNSSDNKSRGFFLRNKITIYLEIKKEDVNKEIYFLDNTKFHDKLGELNENNTTIFFPDNNIYLQFKKYHKFEKEGNYELTLNFTTRLKDCSYMFYGCDNIVKIDLSNFESHNVTNMDEMFCGCNNLSVLDLSSFYTSSVKTMKYMFFLCDALSEINLSNFDTGEVTNMSGMFFLCSNLKNLDLKYFNTKNVRDMSEMFFGCQNLEDLNLSSFDTEKVKCMRGMFYKCTNLQKINLSIFGKNATDMSNMFSHCKSLSKINAFYFKPLNTDKDTMFNECNNDLINKYK